MPETKHTPGPWTLDVFRRRVYAGDHPVAHICDVYWRPRYRAFGENGSLSDYEEISNASLIAAAPDLLKACKSALYSVPFLSYRGDRELEEVEARLIRAIQKAEGQDA